MLLHRLPSFPGHWRDESGTLRKGRTDDTIQMLRDLGYETEGHTPPAWMIADEHGARK